MKGIVVYDSSPGNNGIMAEAIMETLKSAGFEVDLFSANDVKKLKADDYDFLIVGGPARIGMMTFTMRCSIGGKTKGLNGRASRFAAFGTNLVASIEKNGPSAAE